MNILTVKMIPPSPNVTKRAYRNPHAYRRLRKLWENELYYGSLGARHRQELMEAAINGKMRVAIQIFHSRLYDADNLVGSQKVVLDALVNIHFLAGDDGKNLDLMPCEQFIVPRKDAKTVIRIGPATAFPSI